MTEEVLVTSTSPDANAPGLAGQADVTGVADMADVAGIADTAGVAGTSGPSATEPFAAEFLGVSAPGTQLNGQAARPQLIRALNEQLLLGHIRQQGPCSRADLARISGLSKPTVSLALANVERSGLVRIAGQRTGLPGRSARLYELRPDAGFVLGRA
jgi:DNA-binding transcriptional ArsR family regulator